jgi:hypothetical protein
MRNFRLYLIVACLTAWPLVAHAADLEKIERVIAKEPKYQGKPDYCLLVFGPEAEFRVWLVLDGNVLYVDRNGNGDLTESNKRVAPSHKGQGNWLAFSPGAIGTPEGKMKYQLRKVLKSEDGCELYVRGEGRESTLAGNDGPGPLRFAKAAKDAPIIHFLGPLTLQRFDPQEGSVSSDCKLGPLVRGQDCKLGFSLGTPGLGAGTFAKYYFTGEGAASAEIQFTNGKKITVSLPFDG